MTISCKINGCTNDMDNMVRTPTGMMEACKYCAGYIIRITEEVIA